jgi:hypothetical protein
MSGIADEPKKLVGGGLAIVSGVRIEYQSHLHSSKINGIMVCENKKFEDV